MSRLSQPDARAAALPASTALAAHPSESAPALVVRLLGPPQLTRAGAAARPLERKLAAALALAAGGQGLSRERVAGLLWPESGDSTARANLRVLLHRAKEVAGVPLLAPGTGWALAEGIACDLHQPGAELLRRPVLEGCNFDDLEELQRELEGLQARLRDQASSGHLAEAESALHSGTHGGHQRAAALAQAILHTTPIDEPACRLLMKAQVALGQRQAALATYERLRNTLSEELGTQPDRQTRLLQLDILRDNALPALATPSSSADASPVDALRSPRAVGREAIIDQLLGLGALSHHAWLEGDAGVGKSRVIEELLLRTPAVRLRCRPSDSQKAYAVLRRLIGQIELERPAETQASMAELLRPGRTGTGVDFQDVFSGVVEALTRLRRDGVNQVVFEDVHYLDAASGRLIIELGEAMTDDRSLATQLPAFVFTARTRHDNPAFLALREAVQADPHVHGIALSPLNLAQTRALISALAPTQPWLTTPGLAERLHAMSGGNTYFTLEIIRAALATPDPPALAVRVDSVQQLLASRLQETRPEATELAHLLAVAQTDFDPRMARDILGQDGRTMARSWQELVALGLFTTSGFAHDLALTATLESMVGPQAQLLHAQVGEFIERHGGGDDRVAHHLLRSHAPAQALGAITRFVRSMNREGTVEPAIALLQDTEQRVPGLENTEEGFLLLAQLHLWRSSSPKFQLESPPIDLRRLADVARSPEQRLVAQALDWNAMAFRDLGERDAGRELEALWLQPRIWPWWHRVASLLIKRSSDGAPPGETSASSKIDELLTAVEAEDGRWSETLLELGRLGIELSNLSMNDRQRSRLRTLFRAWESLAQQGAATGIAYLLGTVSARLTSMGEGYVVGAEHMAAVLPLCERRGFREASRNGTREWLRFYEAKGGLFARAWSGRWKAGLRQDAVSHPFVATEADIYLAHGLGDLAGAQDLVLRHPAVLRPTSQHQLQVLQLILAAMEQAAAQAEHRPARTAAEILAGLPGPASEEELAEHLMAGAALETLATAHLALPEVQASSLALCTWRFRLLRAYLHQGQVDLARPLMDALLPVNPAWLGHDALTAADSACDLWVALVRCGHPDADVHRDTWRRWRDEQTAGLPGEWHASFRWRHAWVSDEPAPRPASVPRGPWVQA